MKKARRRKIREKAHALVLLSERKRLVSEVEGMIDFKVAYLTQNEGEDDEFHDIYCRGVKALEMHLKDALQDITKVIEK